MPVKKSSNGGKRLVTKPRVTQEEIARRAYDKFLARGRQPGRELEDWLDAERELLKERPAEKRNKALAH